MSKVKNNIPAVCVVIVMLALTLLSGAQEQKKVRKTDNISKQNPNGSQPRQKFGRADGAAKQKVIAAIETALRKKTVQLREGQSVVATSDSGKTKLYVTVQGGKIVDYRLVGPQERIFDFPRRATPSHPVARTTAHKACDDADDFCQEGCKHIWYLTVLITKDAIQSSDVWDACRAGCHEAWEECMRKAKEIQ